MKQLRNALTFMNGLAGLSFLAVVVSDLLSRLSHGICCKIPHSWSEELVSYLFAWVALLEPAW